MKYYKLGNAVFAFDEDASQDSYIKPEMVKMTKAEVAKHVQLTTAPVEQTLPPLTRRQFKLAVLHTGLADKVTQLIAGITDLTEKAILEIEYNESTEFVRTSSSVKYMCSLLELTDVEVDSLWQYALTL